MSAPPPFAIAFTIREKFGWSLPALQRLYGHFGADFNLYFVDCGYPAQVRAALEEFFATKDNVVRIELKEFTPALATLNHVIPRMRGEDHLFSINNDVLIEPGMGEYILDTFHATQCALVAPSTIEVARNGWREAHHEAEVSAAIVEEGGVLRVEVPRPPPAPDAPRAPVHRVHHLEVHAVAFTAQAARALMPFPPLRAREHIDLAVHAWHLGLPVYTDRRARAAFVLPPIRDYDVAFFDQRWDRDQCHASQYEVARRWNITDFPFQFEFSDNWRVFLEPRHVQRAYAGLFEMDTFPLTFG